MVWCVVWCCGVVCGKTVKCTHSPEKQWAYIVMQYSESL